MILQLLLLCYDDLYAHSHNLPYYLRYVCSLVTPSFFRRRDSMNGREGKG